MDLDYKKAQESYNTYSKIYAENTFPRLLQFQLNHFISLLSKNAKILDAGCGCGRDTHYLTEEGFDVIGIDLSEPLLEEAKIRTNLDKFKKMDFLNLEFPEESFDGIWCMAGISSIPKDKIPDAIKQFHKVLKKQGILYIDIREGHGQEIVKKQKYENAPFLHCHLTKQELENLVKELGFHIISSEVSDNQGKRWVEIFAKKIS